MPSAEMLKKLLDEFTQKQSSTQEEIKKTEQQLQELESQIDNCRKKLKFVAQDRQKIQELMEHWRSNGSTASTAAIVKETEPAEAPETSEPSTFSKVAGLRKELRKSSSPPAPTPTPAPAPAASTPEKEAESSGSEPDDAVKSINDALRGLFS